MDTDSLTPYDLLVGLFLFVMLLSGLFQLLFVPPEGYVRVDQLSEKDRFLLPYRRHARELEKSFGSCSLGLSGSQDCDSLLSLVEGGYVDDIKFPPAGYVYVHARSEPNYHLVKLVCDERKRNYVRDLRNQWDEVTTYP